MPEAKQSLTDFDKVELDSALSGLHIAQQIIQNVNDAHGWNEKDINVPEALALIHSEVSEALEEYRKDRTLPAYEGKNGKPEGFEIELADAIIRILHLAERLGMSMGEAVYQKVLYNDTRPFRHGGKTC